MDWYNQIGLVIVIVAFAILAVVKYSQRKSKKAR